MTVAVLVVTLLLSCLLPTHALLRTNQLTSHLTLAHISPYTASKSADIVKLVMILLAGVATALYGFMFATDWSNAWKVRAPPLARAAK